jgi:hypothetical protein
MVAAEAEIAMEAASAIADIPATILEIFILNLLHIVKFINRIISPPIADYSNSFIIISEIINKIKCLREIYAKKVIEFQPNFKVTICAFFTENVYFPLL